ncbi:hypothetical protein [Auraticoccus monumenti]|uniref:hypothetical protein n=1 Tax=Auraticoccus monumenti TaxID=675864 RepID=UPI0012F7FA89|nr:hypothetical protein [Auraticoccus monumenti]
MDTITINAVAPGTAVASLCHSVVRPLGWQTGSVEPGATATRTLVAPSVRTSRQDVLRLVDRSAVGVVDGAMGGDNHPAGYFATAAADPQPRRLT